MKVNVRLFAKARELAAAESVAVELPETATTRELRSALREQFPALAPVSDSLLIAIGDRYATEEQPIPPNEPVAAFPPVSGG